MSKNHPNDNIYSILGKLDALKPTTEEKHQSLLKEIRESVDAKGSITEGVSSVEARLLREFAEGKDEGKPGKTFAKIAKSAGEHYGSAEAGKRVAGAVRAKLAKQGKLEETEVEEKAPPGAKAERMVKGIKKSLSKDGHLSDKDKAIAYATTWKAHNKGQVEEAGQRRGMHGEPEFVGIPGPAKGTPPSPKAITKGADREYYKSPGLMGEPERTRWRKKTTAEGVCAECGMNEGECEHTMSEDSEQFHSGRVELFGKINRVIQGIQTPEQYKNSLGWLKRAFSKLNTDNSGPSFNSKVIRRIQQDARAMEKDLAAKAQELGIEPESFFEAEITRTTGKTVHRKTDFPGYPADDLNDPDVEPTDRKRGRPRKHAVKAPKLSATGEKLGRGRPTKAKAPTFSKQADPFGRISGVVPKGKKGEVHTMAESMDLLNQQLNQMLSEGRLMDDAGETIGHILNRFRAEVRNFEQGGDLDESLYDALYDYYVECGEMPYGVQKARTGDPERWVAEHLQAELGDIAYGKDPANAEGAGLEMEAGIPGNVPTEQIPGKEDLLKGKGRSYYEEEATMEADLNELARLAGIHSEGNAFTGKLATTAPGGEFELDGKTFKDTSSLGETEKSPKADKDYDCDGEIESEKDEVIGSRRKAAGLDESIELPAVPEFQLSTSIDSDGKKSVSVNAEGPQAEALLQMLKMAGLGNSTTAQSLEQEPEVVVVDEPDFAEIEEEGVEVDQPAVAPQNAPNEKYGTIKNITTQGDDLNREKRQDPQTANKAANPMTNAQQVLRSVAQLESKLAEEYESIKKVSK